MPAACLRLLSASSLKMFYESETRFVFLVQSFPSRVLRVDSARFAQNSWPFFVRSLRAFGAQRFARSSCGYRVLVLREGLPSVAAEFYKKKTLHFAFNSFLCLFGIL